MEILQALNVQIRVISALTLRETRSRYGNSKLGFFWALFEPFAHVMVFIAIFSAMRRAVPIGDSIGLFILTGIIPWLLFSKSVNNIMSALNSNKALLGYPQVMPLDIILSRIILDAATFLIVMLLKLSTISLQGLSWLLTNWLKVLSFMGQ